MPSAVQIVPPKHNPITNQAGHHNKPPGRLTIFLGYAPGVGKTYAMLEAARQQQAGGRDAVVALVNCHGQAETEALLPGFERVPVKHSGPPGMLEAELDIDAVLTRRPALALIDDLAHVNVPQCLHEHRWQDIENLIDAGIDVFTTVNVYHFESLNDIVQRITGLTVRETVPDRLLDLAAEVMLVDMPPEALLQRLRQGKIVVPEQATWACQQLFKAGNLIALRELALRRTTARVDLEMRTSRAANLIQSPWVANERLLVCASGSPFSEQLIRATHRLADDLHAQWCTIYVETPRLGREQQENRERVWRDLRLAESLGAEVVTITASSVVEAVVDYATRHNISKIVVGKPTKPRWREVLRPPIVDQIIRLSGAIPVHVVSFTKESVQGNRSPLRWARLGSRFDYLVSLGLVAAATALSFLVRPYFSPINLVMVYLLAVVLAAVRFGRKPAMLSAALGVLAFDFFFVTPRWSFTVADTEYLFTFLGLFVVGVVISTLVAQGNERAEVLREREMQTESLYYLSRDLSSAANLESIMAAVIKNIAASLQAEVAVLRQHEGQLQILAKSGALSLDEKEIAVAEWVVGNQRIAGNSAETFSTAALLYFPLQTSGNVLGVMGVRLRQAADYYSPHQRRILDAFVTQISQAMERVHLNEQAEQAEMLRARESLERALLNSVSHDMRTPLVSIIGALSSLREEQIPLTEASKKNLLQGAWDEAERLNRFVGDLLDMTRLEAGEMKINKEPCDVQDLIGCVLTALDAKLEERKIDINLAEGLSLVRMDMVLMTQVLINLVENALKYSPASGPLEISARLGEGEFILEVLDRGPGIPEADKLRVFEKFYRLPVPERVSGTGLGLSICKGIVEAHQGKISAENREGGGLCVTCRLPL